MTQNRDTNNDEIRWYVMRVYKREQEVEQLLLGSHGLPHFIAKKYYIRIYSGKKKIVLLPSIPGIIFVNSSRKQIHEFKNYCPFIQYCFRKDGDFEVPLVIPEKQMNNFMIIAKQIESDVVYFKPDEVYLKKGQRVKVHGGVFNGLEGTLLKIKGKRSKRIVVRLEGIVAIASSEIEPDLIEVLK